MENKVRAHAIISGRVQGVFFRVETKRAADGFGVLRMGEKSKRWYGRSIV